MSKIHIGKKIREVVQKSELSAIAFSKQMNLSRDGVYKIYAKEFIDTALLKKISEVLKHDFFKYFSEDLQMVKDPKDTFGYATKDELKQGFREMELLFRTEFQKIREELALKNDPYKIKKPRKGKK